MSEARNDNEATAQKERPKLQFYWVGLSVLGLAGFIILQALLLRLDSRPLVGVILVWLALCAGYAFLYADAARKGGASYLRQPSWAAHIRMNPQKFTVPEEYLSRIVSVLIDVNKNGIKYHEDEIVWASRRHWYDLWRRILRSLMLAVVLLGLAITIAVFKHSGSYQVTLPEPKSLSRIHLPSNAGVLPLPSSTQPVSDLPRTPAPTTNPFEHHQAVGFGGRHLNIGWWYVPLLFMQLSLVMLLVAWARSWKWSYRVTMVTNLRVLILTIPRPLLIPLLAKNSESVDHIHIDYVRFSTEGFSNNLKMGDIGLDTQAQKDVDFQNIRYMPYPEEKARALDNARILERQRFGGSGGNYLQNIPQVRPGDPGAPTGRLTKVPVHRYSSPSRQGKSRRN